MPLRDFWRFAPADELRRKEAQRFTAAIKLPGDEPPESPEGPEKFIPGGPVPYEPSPWEKAIGAPPRDVFLPQPGEGSAPPTSAGPPEPPNPFMHAITAGIQQALPSWALVGPFAPPLPRDVGEALQRFQDDLQKRKYPMIGPGGLGLWDPNLDPEFAANRALQSGPQRALAGVAAGQVATAPGPPEGEPIEQSLLRRGLTAGVMGLGALPGERFPVRTGPADELLAAGGEVLSPRVAAEVGQRGMEAARQALGERPSSMWGGTAVEEAPFRAPEGLGALGERVANDLNRAWGQVKAARATAETPPGAEGSGPSTTVPKKPAERFYHGTGTTFETPEAGKFDPDGLFGPGYYLTSDPRIAESYANTRPDPYIHYFKALEDQRAALAGGDVREESRAQTEANIAYYENILENIRKEREVAGPNIRPVDVSKGLNLLDADAPIPPESLQRIGAAIDANLGNGASREFGANLSGQPTGAEVYEALRSLISGGIGARNPDTAGWATRQLQAAGYDGIRYAGGKRVPMLDDAGKPIEHEALVIFPESLPKITNALSQTPMGGAVPGALLASAPGPEGETDEERERRVQLGAGAALAGLGAAGLLRRRRLPRAPGPTHPDARIQALLDAKAAEIPTPGVVDGLRRDVQNILGTIRREPGPSGLMVEHQTTGPMARRGFYVRMEERATRLAGPFPTEAGAQAHIAQLQRSGKERVRGRLVRYDGEVARAIPREVGTIVRELRGLLADASGVPRAVAQGFGRMAAAAEPVKMDEAVPDRTKNAITLSLDDFGGADVTQFLSVLNPAQRLVRDQVRGRLDALGDLLELHGLLDPEDRRNNYVSHIWRLAEEGGGPDMPGPKSPTTRAFFEKQRTFNTFEEGLAKGYVPKTLDPLDLLEHFEVAAWRRMAAAQLIDDIRHTNPDMVRFRMPGKPVPEGFTAIDHPLFSAQVASATVRGEHLGIPGATMDVRDAGSRGGMPTTVRQMVTLVTPVGEAEFDVRMLRPQWVVRDDVAPLFQAMLEPSRLRQTWAGSALLKATATVKRSVLGAPLLADLNMLGFEVRALAHASGLHRMWTIFRGALRTAGRPDLYDAALREDVSLGPVTRTRGEWMSELDRAGLTTSSYRTEISRMLGEETPRTILGRFIPGYERLQTIGEALQFDDLIPKMKYELALYLAGQKVAGGLPVKRALRIAAGDVNRAMGGLNRVELGRSQTTQDFLNLLLIAPDWAESRVRNVIQNFVPGPDGQTARAFTGRMVATGIGATILGTVLWGALNNRDPEKIKDEVERRLSPIRWDVYGRPHVNPDFLTFPLPNGQRATILTWELDVFRLLFGMGAYAAGDFETGDVLAGRYAKARFGVGPRLAMDILRNKDWKEQPITQAETIWGQAADFVRYEVGALSAPANLQEVARIGQGVQSPEGAALSVSGLGRATPRQTMPTALREALEAKQLDATRVSSLYQMEPHEQAALREDPEIRAFLQSRTSESARTGSPVARAREQRSQVEERRLGQEAALLAEFQARQIDPKTFRDRYGDIQGEAAAAIAEANRAFGLDKAWQGGLLPVDPNERALAEYYRAMDQARGESGRYDFDKAESLQAELQARWTPEQRAYVERNSGLARHAPGLEEFQTAKEHYQGYIAIPRYPGLSEEQVKDAEQFQARMKTRAKQLGIPGGLESPIFPELARKYPDEARAYLLWGRVRVSGPGREAQFRRAAYWRQHPLLAKYYGAEQPE